eukprot:RCo050977
MASAVVVANREELRVLKPVPAEEHPAWEMSVQDNSVGVETTTPLAEIWVCPDCEDSNWVMVMDYKSGKETSTSAPDAAAAVSQPDEGKASAKEVYCCSFTVKCDCGWYKVCRYVHTS